VRRFHFAVKTKPHKFTVRLLVQIVVFFTVAICLARFGPLQRFYAQHAPVWGARGTAQPASEFAARIVAGARAQIGTLYDAGYVQIPYPGGDVPRERGACSDVVVRALRSAGVDLQQLIHEDILRAGDSYPHLNSSSEPDANIDHRRCAIQMCFFARHGMTLTNELSPQTREQWQPGDFVYWRQPGNRQHVGVLSDRLNARSFPLVIHNGNVCLEQDCVADLEIIGHYRYTPEENILKPR
jgi:uncharacterized protein YijF (DUF1287 family)